MAPRPCARRWPWAPLAPSMSSTRPSGAPTCGRPSRSLTAALAKMEYDLVFAGADTSDGQGGVVGARTRRAPGPAVPLVRLGDRADRWRGADPAPQRRPATTSSRRRRRRWSWARSCSARRAIRRCAASCRRDRSRSRPGRWRILGVDAEGGIAGAPGQRRSTRDKPAERGGATFVREPADVAVGQIVDFLASRRLI